jgi:hypothetical protein
MIMPDIKFEVELDVHSNEHISVSDAPTMKKDHVRTDLIPICLGLGGLDEIVCYAYYLKAGLLSLNLVRTCPFF